MGFYLLSCKKIESFIWLGLIVVIALLLIGPDYCFADDPDIKAEHQSTNKQNTSNDEVIDLGEVTVTGKIVDDRTANMPAVVESVTAEGIERINAVETSDVFKYMPGSYLRKLYPGSTNSPLVIRGNNSMMTGRRPSFASNKSIGLPCVGSNLLIAALRPMGEILV